MASEAIDILSLGDNLVVPEPGTGIGSYYADAAIWYEHEEQINIAEAIAAALILVWAVSLADDYFDLANDMLDAQFDVSQRIMDIHEAIADHWMNVQHPQNMSVLNEVYGLHGPSPDYSTALQAGQSALGTGLGAVRGTFNMMDRYRADCGLSGCPTDADVNADVSAVFASQYVMRHMENRYYSMEGFYRDAAGSAFRSSRMSPDGIFALLTTAQSTYANIANSALQTADGLSGLAASAMGIFIGGVFGSRA